MIEKPVSRRPQHSRIHERADNGSANVPDCGTRQRHYLPLDPPSEVVPSGHEDPAAHRRDPLASPQAVEAGVAEGSAGPTFLCRPEALRSIVDEEAATPPGDLLQRDEIARQPVQPRGNDAECSAEIEPHECVQIQVERLGIDVTEPDREAGARHRGRNREARVRGDHHLASVRALSQCFQEDCKSSSAR